MSTATKNVEGDAKGVAIGGYSPVSYFEKGLAERGNPDHAVEHEDNTYFFVSADQAKVFRANPEKYLPVHGGACAYGASKGKSLPVDPTSFKIVDGRLLLFLKNDDVDARKLWDQEHDKQCSTGNGGVAVRAEPRTEKFLKGQTLSRKPFKDNH